MDNVEYNGIEYLSDAKIKNYHANQRKKAKRLTERFNKNKEAIALIEKYEEELQKAAYAVYLKMKAGTKKARDRDAVLFHLDMPR